MALDPYASCPCGSGKKFKWCCQPIHVDIDRAFRQEAEGQHEAALRIMDEIIAAHPDNPEAWGRKAQVLYQNGRTDEAEKALDKAFEINPNYPFGYLLRGVFRQQEGEIPGALLLFRKAADLYDPEARDILGQVYTQIGECELKLNRVVAARAALKQALHYEPGNDGLREAFDTTFGEQGRLPLTARREYTFQSPPTSNSPLPSEGEGSGVRGAGRREAWNRALAGAAQGKLTDAARAFEQLTAEDADDAAAWYDLGLVRAWLGDNVRALEALDRYVTLETDEAKAADAWAMGEVLRFGYGMEEHTDAIEHSALFQIHGPQQVFAFLQDWDRRHRLIGVQVRQQEGVLTGLILERLPELTPELARSQLPGIGAYLLVFGDRLRVWNVRAEALDALVSELRQALGQALSEPHRARGVAHFSDVLSEALAFPVGLTDQAEAERRVHEHMQRYFEETWVHRPLRSLNQVPPLDAAGHTVLRRKLRGVVQFLDQCAALSPQQHYDFDRLRRKLGLFAGAAEPAAAPSAAPDVEAMSAAELAGLNPEPLTDDVLEQAYRTALKLDARDLAGRFARVLVSRPARPEKPDRYPWYSHLIQLAVQEGNTDAALDTLNEGEKADCEQNEGRRRNDYELRRGQIHAKRGEADQAEGAFKRLIERSPSELRYRSGAAEAMLSAKQGAKALQFAEQGLAKAREQNNRDSEEHFKELVAAAKRQS
jgi:tetratricopeptide (TPR) repeat protein